MDKPRSFLKKTDIILIIIVLIVSLIVLVFVRSSSNKEKINAVIYVNGEKFQQIDLLKEKDLRQIEINSKLQVVVEVENGAIRFASSQCPDKLCVKSGTLSRLHDTAACLPANVAIVIE